MLTPKPLSSAYRQPPPDFLFDGFLRRKTLTMVTAPPHSAKTQLLIHAMLCAGSGEPLLGHFACPNIANFLYLEQDCPEWDFDLILSKQALALNLTDPELEALGARKIVARGLRWMDPAFQSDLIAAIKDGGFDGVIFDTARRFFDGDENDAAYVSQALQFPERLRDELGMTVLFAHHTGKPTAEIRRTYRGSEVLAGTVDYHLFIESTKQGRIIHWEKGRGHGTADAIGFNLVDTPEGGLILTANPIGHPAMVINKLQADGPLKRATLIEWGMATFGIKDRTRAGVRVDNLLANLRRQGLIESTPDGWKAIATP